MQSSGGWPCGFFGELPEAQAQKGDNRGLFGAHAFNLLRQIDASFFG
jgi:hypothetical protein